MFVISQCEPIPNQGFKRGSYRCTCKRGYYYPDANVNVKAFNGSVIEEEYDKKQEGLPTKYDDEFDCVPCSEGCEECTDGSPCVYNLKIIPRVVLISIDTLATLMAAVAGAVVFIFRESKVGGSLLVEIMCMLSLYNNSSANVLSSYFFIQVVRSGFISDCDFGISNQCKSSTEASDVPRATAPSFC